MQENVLEDKLFEGSIPIFHFKESSLRSTTDRQISSGSHQKQSRRHSVGRLQVSAVSVSGINSSKFPHTDSERASRCRSAPLRLRIETLRSPVAQRDSARTRAVGSRRGLHSEVITTIRMDEQNNIELFISAETDTRISVGESRKKKVFS